MAASRISKGRITEVVKRFKWFPLARPEKYGGSYLKNAWTEAPELVLSLSMAATSLGIMTYLLAKERKDLRSIDKPYKRFYTVYRPDDPRIENLRRRPQFYNVDGEIPDIWASNKEVYKWHSDEERPHAIRADGKERIHGTLQSPHKYKKDDAAPAQGAMSNM